MSNTTAAEQTLTSDTVAATSPSNTRDLPVLLKDITAGVNALVSGNLHDRKDLLTKSRLLVRALETPRETMLYHCWAQAASDRYHRCYTFGVDCGLWKAMAPYGDRPHKVDTLAAELGVEPALLGRIMRHLGATGYLTEVGKDEYLGNGFTKALANPAIAHGYLALIPDMSASVLRLNEFSRERGWKSPADATDSPLMHAYKTDKSLYSWLQEIDREEQFNDYLRGFSLGRLNWVDPSLYPVQERLIDGADQDASAPFLVDIGGNIGSDLIRFKNSFPNPPGRLILQDLPAMTGHITDLDPSIEVMEHDFTTEQPVKGSRAYFMHSCMHNWPTKVCEEILLRVKEAMRPGYSKLLLFEIVIPDVGAYWEDTGLDMIVMAVCASEQRTVEAWHDLIENRVGLKIEKIWGPGRGQESLIECTLG